MSKEIQFSIVICSFNGSRVIERCLDSVFSQNFDKDKYEVIVVDDGSEDGVSEIAKHYPIKLIQHKRNKGITFSRNSGLKVAEGKYLICLDDDCTINTNFLNEIEKKYILPKIMGVAADLVSPQTQSITDFYYQSLWYGVAIPMPPRKKTTIISRILWYYLNSPWSKNRPGYMDGHELLDTPAACTSYKTRLIKQIGGWDEALQNSAEDNDLSIRMNETFSDMKTVLAFNAKVTHYQNLSFINTIKRELLRRNSKILFYKKHRKFPSIFPNPFLFLMLLLLVPAFPISQLLLPVFIYPWWVVRFISDHDPRFLIFPYMQIIHETASNISILLSVLRKS